MPLFKLRLAAADLAAGRAAADTLGALEVPAPLAVTLFEDGPPAHAVEAYYDAAPALDAIAQALASISGIGAPAVEALPDRNWVAVSQDALAPIAAGRFVVHGSHDRGRFALRRHAIEIDAGEAFGTGYNATTALCLEAIDALARRRRFARILDLGCGSGILAIAGARAWPNAHILAADSDPVATAIARENARLNRVAGRIAVIDAAGLAHPRLRASPPFDLVLANLMAATLIDLAPALRRAAHPGGIAILSGLLTHQTREVCAIYRTAGFQLLGRRSRNEWTALTLARHEPRSLRPSRRRFPSPLRGGDGGGGKKRSVAAAFSPHP
jgi:ribosomal protein L11 methyltransferase